ncbi:uncharacterized protein LOC112098980 [Citrus clementina]|uniref:uncharacterized protein LOC112098980 n=1 Tax=Citrus clementina TaxID=85681 RepID=UPI000CED4E02|nr:uncharacterized protein LOC112098980 [Citrus x clementina]
MKSLDEVQDYNLINIVDLIVVKRLNSCYSNKEIKAVTFEELEDEDLETVDIAWLGEKQPVRIDKHFKSIHLSNREVKLYVPSIESPPILELKLLLSYLKYVYISDNNTFPLIISSSLNADQENGLVDVLGKYKKAIKWTIAYIEGISPSICMHKILLEDCYNNSIEQQRILNPIMKKIMKKKKIIKWLDTGIIYLILDSSWVSPVQCVSKKGGATVVANKKSELISTRIVTRWRVCMDYRKLTKATRKDHFPLHFIDQMLDRLAGKEYSYFLDGYSDYNQIVIALEDQEKTTFTCPYGTFAFRRMSFGL